MPNDRNARVHESRDGKHWSVVYTFRILHWPKINQGHVLCNLFERSVGKVPPDSCSYVFRS